ncbi:MAG: hypothetical protein VB090_09110 [Petrimonas sp.]|nr:hypothetical protein [Petrimonas sp.]
MKKLSKIKLHDTVGLEDRETKRILGENDDNNADCTELICIFGAICGGVKDGELAYGKCSSGVLISGSSSCACVFN